MKILILLLLFSIMPCHANIVNLKNKLEISTGCKLKITSGDRSPEHNKRVGGSKGSYHLKPGMALDLIKINCKLSYKDIAKHAKKLFSGVIWYPKHHIHVDLRKNPVFFEGK